MLRRYDGFHLVALLAFVLAGRRKFSPFHHDEAIKREARMECKLFPLDCCSNNKITSKVCLAFPDQYICNLHELTTLLHFMRRFSKQVAS
jgi:hypothetical protein